MRLRLPDYYREQKSELLLDARVPELDIPAKQVHLEKGAKYGFDALLSATGSEPVQLQFEGATSFQLHYLRTLVDARAIVLRAASARRVAVIGASFISFELAASLCSLGVAVDVIAPGSNLWNA
jgi:NAD(P)H-nitrite reductase large subunit